MFKTFTRWLLAGVNLLLGIVGGLMFTVVLIYVGYVLPLHVLQWMFNW